MLIDQYTHLKLPQFYYCVSVHAQTTQKSKVEYIFFYRRWYSQTVMCRCCPEPCRSTSCEMRNQHYLWEKDIWRKHIFNVCISLWMGWAAFLSASEQTYKQICDFASVVKINHIHLSPKYLFRRLFYDLVYKMHAYNHLYNPIFKLRNTTRIIEAETVVKKSSVKDIVMYDITSYTLICLCIFTKYL